MKFLKRLSAVVIFLLSFSCTQDSVIQTESNLQEIDLRKKIGLSTDILSENEKLRIVQYTEQKEFNSIEEARAFIASVRVSSKTVLTQDLIRVSVEKNGLTSKGIPSNVEIDLGGGIIWSVPCSSNFLDPFDGCEDGGGSPGQNCGKGTLNLQTGNVSVNMRFNATLTYDSENGNVTADDFNSHISGLTMGFSYDHINSTHAVGQDGTIDFAINGALNYNLFTEGVGTVYTENVTLRGSINPCDGNSGDLQLYFKE